MARYMLDTNMCIYFMKNQPAEVAERFATCYVGDVVMSAITYAELEFGVAVAADPNRERKTLASLTDDVPVMPFGKAAATSYGIIRSKMRDRSKGQLDKLIAAHAIAAHVVLVTNNERDFSGFPNLIVENWIKPAAPHKD